MKRNILLLTAVVLAAVLMTGCIGPLAKVKLTVEPEDLKVLWTVVATEEGAEDEEFVVANIAKPDKGYKKNTFATITITFVAEPDEGELPEGELAWDSDEMELIIDAGEARIIEKSIAADKAVYEIFMEKDVTVKVTTKAVE